MTKEEQKAKELVEKFGAFEVPVFDGYWYEWKDESMTYEQAKESAIIAVKQIIDLDIWIWHPKTAYDLQYWESVLKHLGQI